MTDVRRERIVLLWSTVRVRECVGQSVCSNMGDTQ